MKLQAIKTMYTCTESILKSAINDATVGVRQGPPSSCLLFVMYEWTYVDHVVRLLKRGIVTDGFLGSLQILLLMDDNCDTRNIETNVFEKTCCC